jgi:hypothetical protein
VSGCKHLMEWEFQRRRHRACGGSSFYYRRKDGTKGTRRVSARESERNPPEPTKDRFGLETRFWASAAQPYQLELERND